MSLESEMFPPDEGGAGENPSATSVQLHRNSARVISDQNTSGGPITYTLPNPATLTDNYHGMLFYIMRRGTQQVVVKNFAGTTLATLNSLNAGVRVQLINIATDKWKARTFTLNTARTHYRGSRSAPVNPAALGTVTPLCYLGTPCEIVKALGAIPLDGQSGRPNAILPMYEDVTAKARNQGRDVIRAADFVPPSIIALQLTRDAFAKDTSHPLNATTLSPGFYEALYNGDMVHALSYYVKQSSQASRHWNHARFNTTGNTWEMGSGATTATVTRHIWRKTVAYNDSTNTPRTLEIRVVAEFAGTCTPTIAAAGGVCNNGNGAWGAVFMVYVFTDELSSSWVDGVSTFTPAGASAAAIFHRDDPCVWGQSDRGVTLSGGSANAAKRYCHPQLVLAASLPTTFYAPINTKWTPADRVAYLYDSSQALTRRGKNLAKWYAASNGSPWLTGCTSGTCSPGATQDVIDNVVFCNVPRTTRSGSDKRAGMTLGGGFPSSKPPEWLCWENPNGTGITYLKALQPGWDGACGTLNIAGGNSAAIYICTSDATGIDDGSGYPKWPTYAFSGCVGHPAELYQTYGGSHGCYRLHSVGLPALSGCWTTSLPAMASFRYRCDGSVDGYAPDGTWAYSRDIAGKMQSETYWLSVDDYEFDSGGRFIYWKSYKTDLTAAFYHYTYSSSDVGGLVTVDGTWSHSGALATVTAVGTGVYAVLLYTAHAQLDSTQTAVLKNALSKAGGFAARSTYSGASYTGYMAQLTPTGGSNATLSIVYVDSDTVTSTIATTNITSLSNNVVTLTYEVWGTRHKLSWSISGGASGSISGDDCTQARYTAGYCGLISNSSSSGAQLENWVVQDDGPHFAEIMGRYEFTGGPSYLNAGIGLPELSHPKELCGGDTGVDVAGEKYYQGSSFGGYQAFTPGTTFDLPSTLTCGSTIYPISFPGGPNPAAVKCGCKWCSGGASPCSSSTPIFQDVAFYPPRCHNDSAGELNAAKGLLGWLYSEVFCV